MEGGVSTAEYMARLRAGQLREERDELSRLTNPMCPRMDVAPWILLERSRQSEIRHVAQLEKSNAEDRALIEERERSIVESLARQARLAEAIERLKANG